MTLTQNELYELILAAVLIVALIAVIAWASRRSGDARNPYACNSASDPSMCVW